MRDIKTADLVDDYEDKVRFCDATWQRFGRRASAYGPISTLKVFEDNALVKQTLSEPGKGRILVVDGGGSTRTALVGDVLAEIGRASGWAGIIVNGAIRDGEALDGMDFLVFSRGRSPIKSTKTAAGHRDLRVTFGQADFIPGQWVYMDADGVLISEHALF
ncbi:ribonuclease E activity regulator RraA [Georhizobium sp. MAB10]|uniref:ribonuclease E activity regulator RraA n=1 Tax=Georhizobium sp. MAB10 TaxID=3028319 RepID=UPI003855ED90